MRIATTVNGIRYERDVEPRLLLVDFLREELDLVGTHVGCEHGVCGTCTVLMDGESIRSCITFAVQADGHELTTVEGLVGNGEMHPLQEAFWEKQGLQCGYCTPGMLLRAQRDPRPRTPTRAARRSRRRSRPTCAAAPATPSSSTRYSMRRSGCERTATPRRPATSRSRTDVPEVPRSRGEGPA